ncbi:MAG: ABC transporter permease [Candidatus Rokubacteria bacterium]|nr:ABC transporter permease [Candidatus Rokubacteria bacterium]
MLTFLVRALWRKLWTLVFISIVSFGVIHLAPGQPSQIDPLNPRFTKEQLLRYRVAFDLDKPLYVQYRLFYQRLFSGELRSFKDNQPVLGKIAERAWNSLPLFLVGTILVWCYAFPLGIASAVRRDSLFDRATTVLVFALISVPGFYLSYLGIIFVVETFQVDVIGLRTFGQQAVGLLPRVMDRMWHLVLPSVLGATAGVAVLSLFVRSQMLEVIRSDYVRTARAKGLSEDTVLYHHALRNGLLPFVTMLGLLIPGLIGGSVIFETIFAWPGIGRLGYEAILGRDYPVVIALNFIAAVLTLIGTLLSDVLYMVVDPRIRLEDGAGR